MSKTLQISLPDDAAAEVSRAVAAGEFASDADAVLAAVQGWRDQREIDLLSPEELRKLWNEGLAGGPGRGLSLEDIKAEGRSRFARG